MSGTDKATEEQGRHGNKATDRMPVNVFENVSAGVASRQVIVSATGMRITAVGVTAEAGALQCFGQQADTTTSQISRDHTTASISQQRAEEDRDQAVNKFEGAWGAGKTLKDSKDHE